MPEQARHEDKDQCDESRCDDNQSLEQLDFMMEMLVLCFDLGNSVLAMDMVQTGVFKWQNLKPCLLSSFKPVSRDKREDV